MGTGWNREGPGRAGWGGRAFRGLEVQGRERGKQRWGGQRASEVYGLRQCGLCSKWDRLELRIWGPFWNITDHAGGGVTLEPEVPNQSFCEPSFSRYSGH